MLTVRGSSDPAVMHCSVLLTYFWFIQQTHDEAKGLQVFDHVLRVALHILLVEYVNQSLQSQK